MITLSEATLEGVPNSALGVAVSGGGDSMALLHLLAARGPGLRAVTVDHGLRAESRAEAAMVAGVCKALSVPHTTLHWRWDHKGNLQSAARLGRQRLISDWAAGQGLAHVALGHTIDDQAETVLMRLLRGSGVDGLSGMAGRRQDGAVTWVRPLLQVRRADLRAYLRGLGVAWVDDPTNEDPHYDRVKIRQAMETLGLDVAGLAATAGRMRLAREVLERDTSALAGVCVTLTPLGEVVIDLAKFAAPEELQLRLLAGILRWISGEGYRPRLENLRGLLAALATTKGQTLHGCVIRSHFGKVFVRREVSKVEPPCPVAAGFWDHRWIVEASKGAVEATHIGALGTKGLQECPDWRETGHAREALLASPALWQDGILQAAPLAGMANGWGCRLLLGEKGLHKTLMTR